MPRHSHHLLKTCLIGCGVCTLLAGQPVKATWSILMADSRTGEIAIGSCTCLTGLDLRENTPVMLVGKGGATAQGLIDGGALYRMQIFDAMFFYDMAPQDIIDLISGGNGFQARQFGIVNTRDQAATFTGSQTGDWAGGTTGHTGDIVYAVQGNVLTGEPVVTAAVDAIINTEGDIPAKLMAAMQAARDMGGDGRCSCDVIHPDSCGSPPPDFSKSAHIGYMLVSRPGDIDGDCDNNGGCARGDYLMNLNVANQQSDDPDPVDQLTVLYNDWRSALQGRPDGITSTVEISPQYLMADGTSTATMTITFLDIEGEPITTDIQSVTVTHAETSAGAGVIGTATDMGGGIFTLTITAQETTGTDKYRIIADDSVRPAQITPDPMLIIRLPGDVDGDGQINQADLGRLLASYLLPADDPFYDPAADMNGDNNVDQTDLGILLAHFEQ